MAVESTIYLRNELGGKGRGLRLYSKLLSQVSPKRHAMLVWIAPPNVGSVKLHEKCGFKKVAHFSEVGKKFGKCIDAGFWQKDGKV